jgi:hypothetical protein
MGNIFNFHGQTTFIDKPKDTIIKDFQNQYITGDNQQANEINSNLLKLIEVILETKNISNEDKNSSVDALHRIATDVKDGKANKLTAKGTLKSIQEIVTKTSEVVSPAIAIIKTLLGFFT